MNECELILGDCLEKMKEIPNESIDCIIIDPPYFVPAVHYNTRKQFARTFGDLGIMEFFFKETFNHFKRIIKPTGTIYIFCDGQSYPLFYYHLFSFCKTIRPLIWDKKTSINGYSWRHQHELIIFCELPKAKPIPSGDGDILRHSAVKVDIRNHPAEKPVELIMKLIEKSTNKYDLILDCFMGSGSVAIASLNLNRKFIGIEKERQYFEIAKKRIGEWENQSRLF